MNYAKIKYFDIANGPGIRTSLFAQGCDIHCMGCFNADTWDFSGGKKFTYDTFLEIYSSLDSPHIQGLSILGGEPLTVHDGHRKTITAICKALKIGFPSNKNIWLWTGYEWEHVKDLPIMDYIDVCIAGPFDITKRDINLKWCGSSNQQVIDVKKTKEAGKVVSYEE